MTRSSYDGVKLLAAMLALCFASCDSASPTSCDPYACDDRCLGQGYPGGLCEQTSCTCIGTQDTSTDALADTAVDTGSDPTVSWGYTPGTQCAVDRTEPCTADEHNDIRQPPQDITIGQACFPNYDVWGTVACGYLEPPCTCSASACLTGEAALSINGGEVCICLNLCTDQADGATCGAASERRCIPVDDVSGAQVFICGGLS